MTITSYDIGICNAALQKIGARPITNFTDGTTESDTISALYDITFEELLASHPWKFALKAQALSVFAEQTLGITPTPLLEGDTTYLLPSDYIRLVQIMSATSNKAVNYKVVGKYVHANAGDLHLYYIGKVDADDLPSFFKSLLINKLAAELCLPITENTSRADTLLRLFEQQFERARIYDNRSDSPQRLEYFSLIDARG